MNSRSVVNIFQLRGNQYLRVGFHGRQGIHGLHLYSSVVYTLCTVLVLRENIPDLALASALGSSLSRTAVIYVFITFRTPARNRPITLDSGDGSVPTGGAKSDEDIDDGAAAQGKNQARSQEQDQVCLLSVQVLYRECIRLTSTGVDDEYLVDREIQRVGTDCLEAEICSQRFGSSWAARMDAGRQTRQTDSHMVRSRLTLSDRRDAVCFLMWGLRAKRREKNTNDHSVFVCDASPVRRKAKSIRNVPYVPFRIVGIR